jgi:D-arabinose 1-dehydrogenase-like Zn-dependent alcohol dehydrogenase
MEYVNDKKMKVARLAGPRKPFAIVDTDRPEPGPGEVVVKIVASGVCHSDLHIARGEFESVKYPITLGHEPAGNVYEVGEGVTGLRKGQPVIVYPARGCGRCWFCLLGEENHCEDGKFIGFDQDGGYAEYLLVESPRYLFPLSGLSLDEGAPLGCAGITAYHSVKAKALPVLHAGDYVVVIGVGGLGHIAIQLLRKMSTCSIVAVDVRRRSLSLAEKLGSDQTVLAGKNLATQVRRVAKEGVGAVIDFVGSTSTLTASYEMLRAGGRLVVVGAAGGHLKMDSGSTNGREVHGSISGSLTEMSELMELARQKQFKVVVKPYPLEQVNEVLKMLEEGRIEGRAVLKP